ncbi:MAG: cation-translocating P-type ATPase [Candidatus Aramenus sulfurataquae]|uniref:Cation-translocating P-type ATPase n=1 Tax=Candidatus Aramenus sulfurataquae TaxID=1326980 RepID=A0ACC6TRS2_9CREN
MENEERKITLRLRSEELKVVGMHCATCVATVSRSVSSVKGVVDVNVNLASGEAKVSLSNAKLKDVVEAIRKAGYDVLTQRATLKVSLNPEEVERLREEIEEMPGVVKAIVNVDGVVYVEFNPLSTNAEAIREALEKEGYKVSVLAGEEEVPEVLASRRELRGYLYALAVGVAFTPLTLIFQYTGLTFLALLFSLPVQLYSGLRFHLGAWRAFKNKTTNMDTLVSLASNVGWLYSLYSFLIGGPTFFDSISLLITFVLAGKTLEAYLKAKSTNEIAGLLSVKAHVLREGREVEVDSSKLEVGDVVVVRAGETIPADGVVEEGMGEVEEAIFTGEVRPSRKVKGSPVIAGSTLVSGALKVYVTRAKNRTYLAQVVQALREAQNAKFPIQKLVDRVSQVFVPAIISIAVAAFLVWKLVMGVPTYEAVLFSVAVLAGACPCPLGLATPMAVLTSVNKLAKKGIVVRDGDAMEKLNQAKVFIFDKTGTLTKGEFKVTKVTVDEETLNAVANLEGYSSHPIAKAISKLAKRKLKVENFSDFPGEGVFGVVEGKSVIVGKKDFVLRNCEGSGEESILVCVDGKVVGGIVVEDELREDAVTTIRQLVKQGKEVYVATGDPDPKLDLGVKVFSGLSPDEKVDLVRKMRKKGLMVFVGDGVNDAQAIREADVGIAVSSGTDIAKYAGDVIVPSVYSILELERMGRRTVKKIKENLAWAFAYNSVLVAIASGLFYPALYLPPEYSALAMSLNSISVVTWSLVS